MQPLNRAERSNAFFRFLLLFLITVAMVVAVVFFSTQVPWKENDKLRQTISRLKDEKTGSETFNTTSTLR